MLPALSETVEVAVENANSPGTSLSTRVTTVVRCAPSDAPAVGERSVTVKVSSASSRKSSLNATTMSLEVSPSRNVTVPLVVM